LVCFNVSIGHFSLDVWFWNLWEGDPFDGFKLITKLNFDEESMNANVIKNLIEESNYTNKYLQTLEKKLGEK
jgi:hypothetical protein